MLTRHAQSGFSLLELLVVVLIIGILSTMFTLSVGLTGGDRELETEADRLMAVISLARDEAVMQGRELGMGFYADGYEFATFYEDFVEYYDEPDESDPSEQSDEPEESDQSEWTVLSNEKLLGQRRLPDGILLELEIDGRSIVLDHSRDDEEKDQDPDSDYVPQIMLFSSGDMSPFVVYFRRRFENTGVQIAFDTEGTVEVTKELE